MCTFRHELLCTEVHGVRTGNILCSPDWRQMWSLMKEQPCQYGRGREDIISVRILGQTGNRREEGEHSFPSSPLCGYCNLVVQLKDFFCRFVMQRFADCKWDRSQMTGPLSLGGSHIYRGRKGWGISRQSKGGCVNFII